MLCLVAVQSLSGQEFSMGVQIGFGQTNLINDKLGRGSLEAGYGFHLNAVAEFSPLEFLHLRLEPGYYRNNSDYIVNTSTHLVNEYFRIPFNIAYSFLEHWSIYAGAYYGFLLGSRSKTIGEFRDDDFYINENADYGIQAGLSYLFAKKLDVGIRYSRGLSDNSTTKEFQSPEVILNDWQNFHHSIGLNIRYKIF